MHDIIEKLKNGDISAFKIIYELYSKKIFSVAVLVTRDERLAEDVVQEVFIKINEKITRLDDVSRIEAWLCRIAYNKAIDVMRNRSKSVLCSDVREILPVNSSVTPENIAMENEDKEELIRLINSLQIEYKQVLYLKYFLDLSVIKISYVLGIPEGTVRSRLTRARTVLKKMLLSSNDNYEENKPGEGSSL